MKVIIAGGRDITDFSLVREAVQKSGFIIDEIVSGGASGVDALGERFAKERGFPLKSFRAEWLTLGKAAGPIRNRKMAEYADALIAIWDGESRGTRNMIKEAEAMNLSVYVHMTKNLSPAQESLQDPTQS